MLCPYKGNKKMIPNEVIKTSIDRIKINSDKIIKCIDYLDEEEMWKDFSPQLVSYGNLLFHLIGNISQYIISGMGNTYLKRERDLEFTGKPDYSKKRLKENFLSTINKAVEVIESLNEDSLKRIYHIQGNKISGVDTLIHVVEHMSYHTGQIIWAVKYFKNVDPDFYKGEDLNKQNIPFK